MNASHESVSVKGGHPLRAARRILVVGVNWIGDCVMAMPALAGLRQACPDAHLALLVKKGLVPLWHLDPHIDSVGEFGVGWNGTWSTVRTVRKGAFDAALILPHSFRSALVPWLAGVRVRRGTPGHQRDWMLTECVSGGTYADRPHQAWEYMALTGVTGDILPEPPYLTVPPDLLEKASTRMGGAAGSVSGPGAVPRVGLFPGAARGPSKRWPEEHFVALGRELVQATGGKVLVLGGASEAELCGRVARAIGAAACSLGGQTSLPELVAILACCDVVVANDSGGMHLAAAAGARVVGIFGLTDPARTGPLGRCARVVVPEGVTGHRDIPRESAQAEAVLRGIAPATVLKVVMELMAGTGPCDG